MTPPTVQESSHPPADHAPGPGNAPQPPRGRRTLGLTLLVVGVGALVGGYFLKTAPRADRKPPERQAPLVDVARVERADVRVHIHAMGPVMAAQEVELKPQVAGELVEVSPELIPGGLFRTGEALMGIEPLDYELAVRQRESEVAAAERDLKLEMGQQLVAKREYELLGEVIADEDRELVLRRPQLDAARQRVAAVQAALEDARLDLARTTIVAPFNSFVRDKHVDRGETVSTTTPLATLVGTDAYWIEVSLPVDDLRWLQIPRRGGEPGSVVRVYNETAWGPEQYRNARVTRLAGDLEPEGRMARLILTIDDPLSLEDANEDDPILLIGSYVRVEIDGNRLRSVVPLGRGLLHDDARVWVMDDEDKLRIREVEIAYRGRNEVLISTGIEAGERVIVTDLSAPVNGMPLRMREERPLKAVADPSFTSEQDETEAKTDDGSRPAG